MGLTVLEVEIGNPSAPEVMEKVEFLIDSGAIYSVVPSSILHRLGIKPAKTIPIETIEGRIIKRRIGEAQIECAGEAATRIVVFASKTDGQVMGVDALEGLRLEMEPLKRRLKKTRAVLAL
ncbi:MAG: hypothetical protein RDV41_00735 [Planctomycetota bacterium]|nr:hypothetical protein [Planctomycetota bacterium]